MKKKIFYLSNIVIMLITIIGVISYAISYNTDLRIFSTVMLVVLSGLGLANAIVFRNKKSWLTAGLVLLGIILQMVANVFIVKNPTALWIVMCLSIVSFIATLVLNTKFSKNDILYIVAFVVPLVLFVNLSQLFGFLNIFNRLWVTLFTILVSGLVGLSISHATREKNKFNMVFSGVSVLQLIYGFGLLIYKQSNVTHQFEPIISIVFYFILLFYALTIFLIGEKSKQNENKVKLNIVNPACIMLVVMIIAYTIVSNFVAFNLVSAKIYKSQYLSMVGENSTLPIIEVNTQDNQLPYSKEDYVNCSFKISNCENEEYNFSVPMAKNYEDEGCVGIRLRGNSTMKVRKRPYRIKFDEKQSLFGLKANKSWVLLADYYDQSYIRNYTAFTLADSFDNLDFTATPHHVALMLNGEFKGLYLLCEQMDEKKGRANVDEDFDINSDTDFPFLVEMDVLAYKEGETGVDNFYVKSVNNHVEIKFPEADERNAKKGNDPVYDYIYEYINAVFKTLTSNQKIEVSFREELVGFEDLVDVESVIDYYLINEIMLNEDAALKSIYFHKTKEGKMQFGPVWDFDFSMTTTWDPPYKESSIEDANIIRFASKSKIYRELFKNEEFYNKVVERYNEKSSAIIETYNYLRDYKSIIDKVAIMDSKMWHGSTGHFQFDMQYDYVRLFLMDRYNFLNSAFAKSYTEFLDLI